MDGQRVGLYRTQGIVLRSIKLGESDRIVSIYTQSHGRLRGVAKGIRKPKSRFGGRLEAFTHVDLQLYKGRSDLDIITQADIIRRSRRLRESYPAFTAASAMADAVERTTPERERNIRLFLLFRTGLEALDASEDPNLVAYAFLVKSASLSGLHPTLTACVECGAKAVTAFSHGRGGAVCTSCVERSDPKVSQSTLSAWSDCLDAEWQDLPAVDPSIRHELSALVLGFVQWHTDSRLRAFSLLAP